jgi:hypothetical protein
MTVVRPFLSYPPCDIEFVWLVEGYGRVVQEVRSVDHHRLKSQTSERFPTKMTHLEFGFANRPPNFLFRAGSDPEDPGSVIVSARAAPHRPYNLAHCRFASRAWIVSDEVSYLTRGVRDSMTKNHPTCA